MPGFAGIWLDTGELEQLQDIKISTKEEAYLLDQMEDKTRGVRIKSPKHRFMKARESKRLEKVSDIAMNMLFKSSIRISAPSWGRYLLLDVLCITLNF